MVAVLDWGLGRVSQVLSRCHKGLARGCNVDHGSLAWGMLGSQFFGRGHVRGHAQGSQVLARDHARGHAWGHAEGHPEGHALGHTWGHA